MAEMTPRQEHLAKLHEAKQRLKTAVGEHHSRDLRKQIFRMERQLRMYDRYQADYGQDFKAPKPDAENMIKNTTKTRL